MEKFSPGEATSKITDRCKSRYCSGLFCFLP